MAKRSTGTGRRRESHSHKTQKRRAIKKLMLEGKKKKPYVKKTN
jgi:hypothetical protein